MDSKELAILKQKLERYRKTLGVARMMEFEKAALPPSAVAAAEQSSRVPKLNFSDPIRASIERGDIPFFRECLTTFNELDPDEYYENLIKKNFISKEEFIQASERFSTHIRSVDLQDKANNLSLAVSQYEELAGQKPATEEELPGDESQGQIQQQEEEQQEQQEDSTGAEDSQNQTTPRVIIRRSGLSPKMEEKLNKANRSMQETRGKLAGENPPQLSEKMGRQLDSANKAMQTGRPVPGEPSPALDRMNQRLSAANRSMRRTAPSRTTLLNSRTRKKALGSLLRGGSGSGGFGLPWLPKWATNLARSAARIIAKAGAQLARAAANGLARAAAQLLPRLGAQAALQAGRSAVIGALPYLSAAAAPIALITTIILGIFGLYLLMQREFEDCGKPGTMNVIKSAKKGQVDPGKTIEYEIVINYKLNCASAQVDNVEFRDTLPPGTTYDESLNSTTSTSLEIVDPFQQGTTGIGDENTTNPLIPPPADNPNNIGGLKPALEGNTLIWKLGTIFPNRSIILNFAVTAPNSDTWLANQATVKYTVSATIGNRIIDSQSRSLQETVAQAAQNVGMEPALLKAFLKVEADQSLQYSEEEFLQFSTPGWWEGLVDNAPTRDGNDPLILRGYAYNGCAYNPKCAAGADVRGITQFEVRTWNGIVPELQQYFPDGYIPDRRVARDAIFGSALHNRQNAEIYVGSSNVVWTEDVIKATGRIYCGGLGAAKTPHIQDGACTQNGISYDDLLWQYYKDFSGGQ